MFGIPEQHIENLVDEVNRVVLFPYDSLEEECGELISAIAKFTSSDVIGVAEIDSFVGHITEEMAHVLISMNLVARKLHISMDDIKAEVLRKAESGNFDITNYIW